MKHSIFKLSIDKEIGKVNDKSSDSIAQAISNAYTYSCMNTAKTAFGSVFLSPGGDSRNDLKKSILNCLNGIKKCEDIKNTKPSWTIMAVGILNFWTKATFTPGLPPPPCISPAPGPPSSSGTKVLGGDANKLSNKLYEIAGKFKENFDEWVDLLFDALVDFHLTLFGTYFGMAIVGLASVPFQVPWFGIFSSANDSSKNPPVEKVKPDGGIGSKLSNIVEFEKKYEHEMFEYALVTYFNGREIWEGTNYEPGSVSVSEEVEQISDWRISELILTHNHPIQIKEGDVILGFGGAFSPEDIIFAIAYNYYEFRAVDQLYKYILQRPKKGWDDLVQSKGLTTYGVGKSVESRPMYRIKPEVKQSIFDNYDTVYGDRLNGIKSDERRSTKLIKEVITILDDTDKNMISNQATSYDLKAMVSHLDATNAAAMAVCSRLGIPYQRILRGKFK